MDVQKQLIDMLAKIVNRSARPDDATGVGRNRLTKVPHGLLEDARELLESLRGTEHETTEVRHATNRVW